MNNDLTARYIYAVTKQLPYKMRADVQKELDALISDMLAERCGDITPTEKDEQIVLLELGSPDELAFKYSGEEQRALISGTNFLAYKTALRTSILIAVPILTVINILAFFASGNVPITDYSVFAKELAQAFFEIAGVCLCSFAAITIIFAFFERRKIVLGSETPLSSLPPVPTETARISPIEPLLGFIWIMLSSICILRFTQFFGMWNKETGWISAFIVPVFRSFWPIIVLWVALSMVKELAKFLEGQYTMRLAVVTGVCNIPIIICAAIILLNDKIMNPEFVSRMSELLKVSGDAVNVPIVIVSNLNYILFIVVLFALILETVTMTVKAFKYK